MRQNFFTPFDGVFTADNYIILIFGQNFFVHMAAFPNLDTIQQCSGLLNEKNRTVMDILG